LTWSKKTGSIRRPVHWRVSSKNKLFEIASPSYAPASMKTNLLLLDE